MKNGFARGKKLYPAHYALLYFTKGMPASFQRPKILPLDVVIATTGQGLWGLSEVRS